jgi:hypothetical protein
VDFNTAAATKLISSASTDLFEDVFAGDVIKSTLVGDSGNDAAQLNVRAGTGGLGGGEVVGGLRVGCVCLARPFIQSLTVFFFHS